MGVARPKLDLISKQGLGGLDALGDAPVECPLRLVERRATSEMLAERPVAAVLAERGGHQVADASQAEERVTVAAHHDADAHHLGETRER